MGCMLLCACMDQTWFGVHGSVRDKAEVPGPSLANLTLLIQIPQHLVQYLWLSLFADKLVSVSFYCSVKICFA